MRGERRGGRLAVGAGDRDERRVGRGQAALAAEQLDVADHLDGGIARKPDHPVRRRMGQRYARREHERGNPAPVDVAQIRGRDAGGGGFGDLFGLVVEADHVRAARQQRARARKAGGAQPEHRDLLPREGGDRDHRSLSVARPASANPIEMIQNRITICGSVQPFFSK